MTTLVTIEGVSKTLHGTQTIFSRLLHEVFSHALRSPRIRSRLASTRVFNRSSTKHDVLQKATTIMGASLKEPIKYHVCLWHTKQCP